MSTERSAESRAQPTHEGVASATATRPNPAPLRPAETLDIEAAVHLGETIAAARLSQSDRQTEPGARPPSDQVSERDGGPIAGRYVQAGLIARGAMGEVHRVFDTRLQTHFAMKLMLPGVARRSGAQERFEREIYVTARLNHPGILSVHDRGTLPDGRPWYTMDEVRGITLTEAIFAHHRANTSAPTAPGDWTARRLISVFHQLCQAVAAAHVERVIHRDLKPDNVMVGRFGEVRVMDWGLARVLDEPETAALSALAERRATDADRRTLAGHVLGTPIYMAPEQAEGHNDRLGPAADVYALGVILFEIITGAPPWTRAPTPEQRRDPPTPEQLDKGAHLELCGICARAMRADPDARFADAGALADELSVYLDGARRRAEAIAVLDAAAAHRPKARLLLDRAAERAHAARAALADLPIDASPNDKAEAWREQDLARRDRAAARRLELEAVLSARAALNIAPELTDAHTLLADHYADRLREAEAEGRAEEAEELVEQLKVHDRGEHWPLIRGLARISLRSNPSGATVRAFRFEEVGRRLVPVDTGVIGQTPLREVELPFGSYVLELSAPGHHPLRLPVALGRLEHERWLHPRTRAPAVHRLARLDALSADELLVPAGWFRSGGDPQAIDAFDEARLWLDPFVVQRRPVTQEAYLGFLRARVAAGAPLDGLLPPDGATGAWSTGPDGLPALIAPTAGLPITGLSLAASHAYAAHEAARTGRPWRLPHDQEWEKAARGVDGRKYPWGDYFEPAWCLMSQTRPGKAAVCPVHEFPEDIGPNGVQGAAGNVRERCRNRYRRAPLPDRSIVDVLGDDADDSAQHVIVRGGSATSMAFHCRLAGRFVSSPHDRSPILGMRLVASAHTP